MFSSGSRYARTPVATFESADGRTFEYVRRRRIPRGAPSSALAEVGPAERPDLIAQRVLGDPTLFWHLCDQNDVLDPADLATPGSVLHVSPLAGPGTFPGAAP